MAVDDDFDLLNWRAGGDRVTPGFTVHAHDHFSEFLDVSLKAIENQSDPDIAFGWFTSFIATTNRMLGIDARLMDKVSGSIGRYKNAARSLAKKVGAESFTISAGLPAGVSVSFTFGIS